MRKGGLEKGAQQMEVADPSYSVEVEHEDEGLGGLLPKLLQYELSSVGHASTVQIDAFTAMAEVVDGLHEVQEAVEELNLPLDGLFAHRPVLHHDEQIPVLTFHMTFGIGCLSIADHTVLGRASAVAIPG